MNDHIQNLKDFFQAEPLQTSREVENRSAIESANTKWQKTIKMIFSTENLGHNFLNLASMVSFFFMELSLFSRNKLK